MERYGKWWIEASREQNSTSLAMEGVPTDITEEQIITGVMAGLRPEIASEARGRLASISCKRMYTRRGLPAVPKSAEKTATEARKAPSRAVRVFQPSDLKEYVLKKGYLRLHFSCARNSRLCAPYILLQSLQTYGGSFYKISSVSL